MKFCRDCKYLTFNATCKACPDHINEVTGKAIYSSIEYSRSRSCRGEKFERAGAVKRVINILALELRE